MVGGLNKSRMDRMHCRECKREFQENESKMMTKEYDGFLCNECCEKIDLDERKKWGVRVK